MEVNITALAATITALGVVFGAVFGIYRWFLKQEKQDKDIKSIKEEHSVLVHGVLACLQGLREKGCNSPVTAAIEQIENHINKQAHK